MEGTSDPHCRLHLHHGILQPNQAGSMWMASSAHGGGSSLVGICHDARPGQALHVSESMQQSQGLSGGRCIDVAVEHLYPVLLVNLKKLTESDSF